MIISKKMQDSLNEQVVHELHSHNAYLAIAGFIDSLGLKVLSRRFFEQADEERTHALKIINFIMDVGATVAVGAIPTTTNKFKTVEEAVEASLKQEERVTAQINNLMALAQKEKDYATASFLQWFIDEQVEEIASMSDLLSLIRRAGPANILLVEDRILREESDKHPT